MNQRNSSGLPLRAMVMVLLFLGVVFLLVGFQAMGNGDDEGDQPPIAATSTTSTPTSTSAVAPAKPPVRVYNVSDVTGAADGVAKTLIDQQWSATAENLTLAELPPVTTVYWGPTPGEREAAEEVGTILAAPVAERLAELADQPPGVIVIVTG